MRDTISPYAYIKEKCNANLEHSAVMNFVQMNGTVIDFVPGVSQKPLASCVPQELYWLHDPPHPSWSQNDTSALALRQAVPPAAMHVAPALYTVQLPPQTSPERLVQYTTFTLPPSRALSVLDLGVAQVTLASVVASQVRRSES